MFDFAKPYLHLIELGAILIAFAALSWEWHEHNLKQQAIGAQTIKQADAAALNKRLAEVTLENGQLKLKATTADHAHDQELQDLRAYRADHPLHGGLCLNGSSRGINSMPTTTAPDSGHAGPGAIAGNVQQMSASIAGPGGRPEFDARGLLDLLAARGDQISAQLRDWQSR